MATEFEKYCQNLSFRPWKYTSPIDPGYNCLAWAVENNQEYFDSSPVKGVHWPAELPKTLSSVEQWVEIVKSYGYETCSDGSHETGYEKVAIYQTADGEASHAIRQLQSGKWTSKMGALEDIEFEHLDALDGEDYGAIAVFLKRHRPDWDMSERRNMTR